MFKKWFETFNLIPAEKRGQLIVISILFLIAACFMSASIIDRITLSNNHVYVLGSIKSYHVDKRGRHYRIDYKIDYRFNNKNYSGSFSPDMPYVYGTSGYVFMEVYKSNPAFAVMVSQARVGQCMRNPIYLDSAWNELPECPVDTTLL